MCIGFFSSGHGSTVDKSPIFFLCGSASTVHQSLKLFGSLMGSLHLLQHCFLLFLSSLEQKKRLPDLYSSRITYM